MLNTVKLRHRKETLTNKDQGVCRLGLRPDFVLCW